MTVRTAIKRTTYGNWKVIAWLLVVFALPHAVAAQVPGRCEVPVSERTSDFGCYLVATQALPTRLSGSMSWHLYTYPTRAAAESEKTSTGTVVESFGKVWLYTIAEEAWHPSGGERVAVIGPFTISAGSQYTARYMEATFTPGMKAAIHRHSGPEAWYLVSGTQCLETPDGFKVAHAGESAVVPEGPPMALSSVGTEIRRSVLLVLHGSSQPWITMDHDWQPKGLCPR